MGVIETQKSFLADSLLNHSTISNYYMNLNIF